MGISSIKKFALGKMRAIAGLTAAMKIRSRFFIYLFSFAILLIALLWVSQTLLLPTIYKEVKIHEIKKTMRQIERSVKDENIAKLSEEIEKRDDIAIEIISDSRTIHSSTNERLREIMPPDFEGNSFTVMPDGADSLLWEVVRENGGEYIAYPEEKSETEIRGMIRENFIVLAKIVGSENDETLVVLRGQISPVESVVSTIRVELIFISILILLLAGVIAYVMARKTSKPIVEINRSAKELALGNFAAVFPEKGDIEIRELSKSLNEMAQELSKLESLRDEFIANVSHDLRTPLTMVMGYAEAMKDIPGEATPENASYIIEETKRLKEIVNDLLSFTTLKENGAELQTEKFNLGKEIADMAKRTQEFYKSEGYEIKVSGAKNLLVSANKPMLLRAFYNLLSNAIKHIGSDKKVSIKILKTEAGHRISVCDNGDGIKKEDIPYIWNRYHSGRMGGTGIGLSIAEAVFKRHGFRFGVESEEGKGSEFWFEA